MYICECGKIFDKPNNFNAHKGACRVHLGEEKYLKRVEQRRQSAKKAHLITDTRNLQNRIKKEQQWLQTDHYCEYCGNLIHQKYGSGRFCNATCARSFSSSHNEHFHKSDSRYRKIAFSLYPHKCAVCNWDEDERILQVHHIDGCRSNSNPNNLIILCPTCHFKITLKLYKLINENNCWLIIKL